ncbi:MAG TPA: hypothetical protein VLJ44_02140 [Gaiellaceae bacterium]|nr:hypothetical protein [Gaiellaceae bacterium]
MAELELSRAPGERRLYVLDGVGSIRFEGLFSRAATAESNGEQWHLVRRGIFGQRSAALDQAGATVGQFEPRTFRRGGAITWNGRRLSLRPSSSWRERYTLADGETELAHFDGKAWGRRPVSVSLEEAAANEGGLLLFVAFIVRGLAEDAGAAAGAAASTAATGG